MYKRQVLENSDGKVAFIKTDGPTALAYREKELIGHGTAVHPHGFGSPLGRLKGINLAIEDMSPRDLEAYHIYEGKTVELLFEGDISLKGDVVTGTRNLQGKIVLITFKNCLVKHQEEVLFDPAWGIFHLAVGKEVVSAFSGPADTTSFNLVEHELSASSTIIPKTEKVAALERLYTQVRKYRAGEDTTVDLVEIVAIVEKDYPDEWLLLLEIYELVRLTQPQISDKVLHLLTQIKAKRTDLVELIEEGMKLIPVSV